MDAAEREDDLFTGSASARNVWTCLATAGLWLVCALAAPLLLVSPLFFPFPAAVAAAAAWLSYGIVVNRRWSVHVSREQITWDHRYLKPGSRLAAELKEVRRITVVRTRTGLFTPDDVAISLQLRDGRQQGLPSWLTSHIDHIALLRAIETASPTVVVRYSA